MAESIIKKVGGDLYNKSMEIFGRQFDVSNMIKVYLNDKREVYAGEWLDSKGVVSFNSG